METITAKEIGEKFVAFVTEVFMIPEGCSRPEVGEELIRLGDSGELQQVRKDRKNDTDALIDEILSCSPGSRPELFLKTDSTTLALVYDRVHCGTHSMIEQAGKGVEMPRKGMPPFPVFFRQVLLQKFS